MILREVRKLEKKQEYLNEENYERGKKKLKKIALVILIIGVLIGGSLIVTGLVKQGQINSQYSQDSKNDKKEQLEQEKQQLTQELDAEKQNLLTSKTNLENKIKPVEDEIKNLESEKRSAFMNGGFSDKYYEIEDKIKELNDSIKSDKSSLSVIADALAENFDYCVFSEASNNTYTSNYCSLKNQVTKKDVEIKALDLEYSNFNKESKSYENMAFYVIGAIVILVSGGISLAIFMFVKRREIMAFTAQQVMPVAQEGIEKMAPTVGGAVGEVAKSITKGIKEGLNDSKENK